MGEARRALEAFPVSLGVARAEEGQGQDLLALADLRMYEEKRRKKGD
ncbi:translation initiation factor IF-2 [Thermus thermophilus]|nr:translation initiation factor IF-2 [Thermus thermophilus]